MNTVWTMISEHRVESALACAQGGWGFCCVELVRNPALFIQSTHWSLLFPPTGHLHHSQKYHLREIWFLLGQLLHLHYIAPSPDVRFLFFRSLQGTEQMLFFFFPDVFLKSFLFQLWMKTNYHKTSFINTEREWGVEKYRNVQTLQET